MTTIVFDGKVLAADTRGTLNFSTDIQKRHCPECDAHLTHTHVKADKIYLPEKEIIFANEKVIALVGAGLIGISDYMIFLLSTHPEPLAAIRKLPKTFNRQDGSTLLILTEQNVYTLTSIGKLTKHNKLPVALGSGSQAALLAMKEGANACRAVQKASLVDGGTNDVVDYIEVVQSVKYTVLRFKPEDKLKV